MNMLTLQLQQEERNFEQALARKKQFWGNKRNNTKNKSAESIIVES